jgi:hypothetical protein
MKVPYAGKEIRLPTAEYQMGLCYVDALTYPPLPPLSYTIFYLYKKEDGSYVYRNEDGTGYEIEYEFKYKADKDEVKRLQNLQFKAHCKKLEELKREQ